MSDKTISLSEWIKEYCEEKSITLPDNIPDEYSALLFILISMNERKGE